MGQNIGRSGTTPRLFISRLEIYDLEHTKKFYSSLRYSDSRSRRIMKYCSEEPRYVVIINVVYLLLDEKTTRLRFGKINPPPNTANDIWKYFTEFTWTIWQNKNLSANYKKKAKEYYICRLKTDNLDFLKLLLNYGEIQIQDFERFNNPITHIALLLAPRDSKLEPSPRDSKLEPSGQLIRPGRGMQRNANMLFWNLKCHKYIYKIEEFEMELQKTLSVRPGIFRLHVTYPTLHILQREGLIKQKIFFYNSNMKYYFRQYANKYYSNTLIFIGPFQLLFAKVLARRIVGKISSSLLFSYINHPSNSATICSYFPEPLKIEN